jgi:hypothetical protein
MSKPIIYSNERDVYNKLETHVPDGYHQVNATIDSNFNVDIGVMIVKEMLDTPPHKFNTRGDYYDLYIPEVITSRKEMTESHISFCMLLHLKAYIDPMFRTKIKETDVKALKEIKGEMELGEIRGSIIRFSADGVKNCSFDFVFG